jgi:hypothetical protein
MTTKQVTNWREALRKWGKWTQSIEAARANFLKQHGDLEQLKERALALHYESDTGSLPSSHKAELDKIDTALWDIYNGADTIGSEFISNEIGLQVGSQYFPLFFTRWMQSVIPELTQGWDEDSPLEQYLLDEGLIHVWHKSEIDRKRRKGEIIDSISWYRGKVEPNKIAENLQAMKWTPDEQVIKEKKGGRRSERVRADCEAIVCSVLCHEQGLKHKQIADIFGYKKQVDRQGNIMSRTVSNRVKRGDELRQR